MKRWLSLLIACIFVLSLSACAPAQQPAPEGQEPPQDNTPSTPEPEQTPDDEPQGGGILIAYFSCTGNTKSVAELLAQVSAGDLYEIVPEQPYTAEDLNYNDADSRASRENDDPAARPALSGSVENLEDYDVIFLGYPIWWGEAPRIISTFLESHDFAGKTIVPFCTSASSGMGDSAENLRALCSDSTTWLDGRRFGASAGEEEVAAWVESLALVERGGGAH